MGKFVIWGSFVAYEGYHRPPHESGEPDVKPVIDSALMRQFLNKRKPSLRPILKDFGVGCSPPLTAGLTPGHTAAT